MQMRFQSTASHSEGGYALVSLLLVMSLLALFALGAAQNVRQQAQREREKEAIFRGEQVGDAIRSYYRYRGAQGAGSGEWKLVGPTSQDVGAFVKSLTVYSGGVPPTPRGDMARLASLIPQMANVLNTESTNTAPGGEDDSANSSGPFLGVTSRSQRNSVMTYYGIDRHDGWLFTPLFR